MNLKKVCQMCLTNNLPKPKLCYVKTIACEAVQVNEGNNKNARSPIRSPNKLLNYIIIMLSGERENNIPHAHVGEFFLYSLYILNLFSMISIFIFFTLTCARIFLFTRSLLINFKIKTNSYQVNDIKKLFPTHSLVHLRG